MFCKASVFQLIFQAGMQAKAGRMLISSAGLCPALILNKWMRERGAVERWPGICMGWNRLQAARGGGMCRGRVSSDFVLASCLSQFYF